MLIQTKAADRALTFSGKKKGGGVAVFVSERWCSPRHMTVKERHVSPVTELLAVSMWLQLFARGMLLCHTDQFHVSLSADEAAACDVRHATAAQHPKELG